MQLQVIVNFLHLENALFCAEQAVLGGADALEIGNTLIKNAGLHCLRICRDKFPDTPIIADLKLLVARTAEIQKTAEAGVRAVTVYGAILLPEWEKCVQLVHAAGMQAFLDFRDMAPSLIRQQLSLLPLADMVLLDLQAGDDMAYLLQEIAYRHGKPLAVSGARPADNLGELFSLGAERVVCEYREGETQDVRTAVQGLRQNLAQIQPAAAASVSPHVYSEEQLLQKLSLTSPAHVGAVCQERPVFLERVFPLLRFTKVFGRAATIKVWGGIKPVLDFLLEIPSGSIVVVDGSGDASPIWNGLATVLASKRSLAGAVVYGTVTEIQHVRAKNFPCYAAALTALPVRTNDMCQKNVPLQLGSVTVNPDDWLIGDDSGLVCIPAAQVFTITQRAVQLSQQQEQILREIEATSDWERVKQLVAGYAKA